MSYYKTGKTIDDIIESFDRVNKLVSSGQITTTQGKNISILLERNRVALENKTKGLSISPDNMANLDLSKLSNDQFGALHSRVNEFYLKDLSREDIQREIKKLIGSEEKTAGQSQTIH